VRDLTYQRVGSDASIALLGYGKALGEILHPAHIAAEKMACHPKLSGGSRAKGGGPPETRTPDPLIKSHRKKSPQRNTDHESQAHRGRDSTTLSLSHRSSPDLHAQNTHSGPSLKPESLSPKELVVFSADWTTILSVSEELVNGVVASDGCRSRGPLRAAWPTMLCLFSEAPSKSDPSVSPDFSGGATRQAKLHEPYYRGRSQARSKWRDLANRPGDWESSGLG
jgi:hypothetical protein